MGNVSDKSCRENQNRPFMFNVFFFLENRAFYEIVWKKCCRAGHATDTHSEYVILTALQCYVIGLLPVLVVYNSHSISEISREPALL